MLNRCNSINVVSTLSKQRWWTLTIVDWVQYERLMYTSHIKSPAFTYALIILHYNIIFDKHIKHIFTQNILKREVLGSRFKGNPKLFCNKVFFFLFFVSTLNSMGGVLRNARVSEWLKMRKSFWIYYYQDTISGIKINNININKLFYYFWLQHYFTQSWKIKFSKNLEQKSGAKI